MTPEAVIAIVGGLAVGSGIGFVLGRYASGGWLLAFCLILGGIALGLMSSPVLEAIGIPRDGFNYLGYFALSMLVLVPALVGAILSGGIALWRVSRIAGPDSVKD